MQASGQATSASDGRAAHELLRLVRIELQAFELVALLAGAPCRLPAPRWPGGRAGLAAGRRAAPGGLHGPAPRPATSASAGQAVHELLRPVRIELQAFELVALLAGAPCRLPAPLWRRAGLVDGLDAGRRAAPGGLHGPAPRPSTSASNGQAVRELLRLVRIELQAFKLVALLTGALYRLPAPPWRRAGLVDGPALRPAASDGQAVHELLALPADMAQKF